MSMNTSMLNNLSESRKETKSLKFGIDRLLSISESNEEKKSEKHCLSNILPSIISYTSVSKPTPTIAIPCSDCVSSLYRSCKVSPTSCGQADLPGYVGSHFFGSVPSTYTIQPIRPFATRPGIRLQPENHSQPTVTNNISIGQSNQNKRKRSWSRAVFSNLQRKGLERRFQLQKYITKPDRRQLAATLGLTDAQVKVWFQNRRMKWRHSRESTQNSDNAADSTQDDMQIDVDTVTEDAE